MLGLTLVAAFALGMLGLSFFIRRRGRRPSLRPIDAFASVPRLIGHAVETGHRVHVSLGSGSIHGPDSAAALAGLSLLSRVADTASVSDRPPVATTGDGATAILAQDVLRASFARQNVSDRYDPNLGRVTGLTPISFAAGAMSTIPDENVSANLLVGSFGIEGALIADAADRADTVVVAGSDRPQGQAVLYANAHEPLVGEELFAAGAYLSPSPFHVASLHVQDVFRWLVVLAILGGAIAKTLGVLP